ncbi:helix-turn-helix transcriptional regulator [Cohnella nanjingensis]|uniref:Transcriptional regulator n=1 Tax=Cohnella nanjingensis TaxID=1387779 RepID=A0A7X0RWD4_9BACL|nr:helix-turn-helix transcriptional regulator [Cohnella nanjingensis]MBB6674909.1 transcriptional regulator [Cohnella nanjingensis]
MESVNDEQSFLTDLVEGLAAQFGDRCEVVLHDLKRPYDSTIVAIANGHVTGRQVGDPGTNLGLELLRGQSVNGNKLNYMTQTKDGRILRSSSLYMRNGAGEVVGSLCMNFDVTELMVANHTLQSLIGSGTQTEVKESFVTSVGELLGALIQEAQERIGKPVAAMTKDDKVRMIRLLDAKGAFLVKKGGEKIGAYLNISKYTLYSYLEESKQQAAEGGEAR